MFNLGMPELVVIAAVVVLLFGTKRLPELGSGLGKAISNFKKSYKDGIAIDVTPDQSSTTSKEAVKSAAENDKK